MSFINYDNRGNQGNSSNGIVGALVLVLFFVALFFVARAVFNLLAFVAPILFILALILDYKGVMNYGKFIIKLVKEQPALGIIAGILSFVGFPVVSGFLFFKAVGKRIIKSKLKQKEPEFAEFEEVEEEDEDFLDLPELEKPVQVRSRKSEGNSSKGNSPKEETNDYEQLFD